MTPASEQEAIVQAAIAGIPKIASAIAALPKEHHEQAFKAVEQSYRETIRNLRGSSWNRVGDFCG